MGQLDYGTKSHGWLRNYGKNACPECASCCPTMFMAARRQQEALKGGYFPITPKPPCDFYIITMEFRFPLIQQVGLTRRVLYSIMNEEGARGTAFVWTNSTSPSASARGNRNWNCSLRESGSEWF